MMRCTSVLPLSLMRRDRLVVDTLKNESKDSGLKIVLGRCTFDEDTLPSSRSINGYRRLFLVIFTNNCLSN